MAYTFDIIRATGKSLFSPPPESIFAKTIKASAPITQALFSPDEQYLVFLLANKQIQLLTLKNIKSGLQQYTTTSISNDFRASCIYFSPYHNNLLVIIANKNFILFDMEKKLTTHGIIAKNIDKTIFSPDKNKIAFVLDEALQIGNISNESKISVEFTHFIEDLPIITCATFSLDSSKLICGAADNSVLIFDVASGNPLLKYNIFSSKEPNNLKACGHFQLNARQEIIVFLLENNTFVTLDFAKSSSVQLRTYNTPRQHIESVNFPYVYLNEKQVVFLNSDIALKIKGSYAILKMKDSAFIRNMTSLNPSTESCFSIYVDDELAIEKRSLAKLDKAVTTRVSPRGVFFLITKITTSEFELYNLSNDSDSLSVTSSPMRSVTYQGHTSLTISSSRGVSWCKISPDGRYWVFGYGEGIKIFSRNLQTELFSELIISNFPTNYTSIPCVAFSADDKFLAIAFNEQTFLDSYQDNITKNNILFFNINENFLQEKKLVFEKTIHFISFITNAELLINFLDQSVSTKGLGDYSFESPLLITLQHGKILACNIHDKNTFMITQQKSVNSVVTQRGTKVLSDFYTLSNIEEDILAISNDGNFILSYNHGEYQYIVKKKSPSEIIYQVIQNPGQKTGVFSKNSKYLLYSALNKIVLFDIEKKRISKEFSSSDTISFCEFSPNGREVIIGNTSGMIDIYDISYLLPQTDIISLIAQQFSLEQEGFIDYEQYIHYFGVKNSFDYIINSEKITLAGVSAFQRTAAVDQSRKMTNQQVREQLNKIMTPSSNELAFTRALLMSIAHPHGLAKININDFSLKEVYVNVTKSVNFSFYETWNIALELRYFKNVDLEPKTALDKLKGVADIKGLNNYFSIHVQYDLTQMYITLKQDTIKLTFLGTLKAEESAIKQQLEKTLASVARAPSPILPPALASPQKAMPAENSVIAKIREVAEIIRKDE